MSPTTVTGTWTIRGGRDDQFHSGAGGERQLQHRLPLAEGPNVITANATTPDGGVGTASISVTLDTTPPTSP